jgi:hypothetical protein
MTIKVNVDTISDEDIQAIIDYYNQNKPVGEEPINRLNRYEGGFQIRIPDMKDVMCDANKKIKQLRWHKQCLVAGFYLGFTDEEEDLLYKSLVHVLGKDNVISS